MSNGANRSLPHRWTSVAMALGLVLVLGALSLIVYFAAESKWEGEEGHPTVFPYLAAAVLFFASCVWVVLEGQATVAGPVEKSGKAPARAGLAVFAVLFALLSWKGMAGPAGLQAVENINCYLFIGNPWNCSVPSQYQQIFNYVAAAGNATAIGVVVYLGVKCFELTSAAEKSNDARISLRSYVRAMSELLTLASTVLVTSTLALYLLFIAAAELGQSIPQGGKDRVAKTSKASQPVEGVNAKSGLHWTPSIKCRSPAAAAPLECVISAPEPKTPNSIAPAMAFVAGLSFTGALFFLFMTASAALEDVIQRNLDRARTTSGKTDDFSTKEWLERQGLVEGSKELLFRGLAVVAPAATGAIALISG